MKWLVTLLFPLAVLALTVACDEGEEAPAPAASPTATAQATPTSEASPTTWQEIGPESVWDPAQDETRLGRLHECGPVDTLTECVRPIMQELGASPQAIEFWRLTGWFLGDFQEMGTVDLATIIDPWRANENVQLALLNGTPAVVYPEEEGVPVAIEQDSNYDALVAAFPDLDFWPSGGVFEALSAPDHEGQRFVLQFRLIDGCRACSTGYFARVALDFAADGTYMGAPRLLGVCRGQGPDVKPVDASIDACPLP